MSFIDIREGENIISAQFIKKDEDTGLTHVLFENGDIKQVSDDMILVNYNTEDYIQLIDRQETTMRLMKEKKSDFSYDFVDKYIKHCHKKLDTIVIKIQDEFRSSVHTIPNLPKKYIPSIGIYGIPNAVPPELCDLVNDVANTKFETKNKDDCTDLSYGFGRYELKLKEVGPVADMVKHLHETIIKEEYDTHSITCFVSEPGSTTQPYHRDFHESDMYCIFVALQDFTHEMGPPVFLPHTSSDNAFNDYRNTWRIGEVIRQPYYEAIIKKGDAILFDVRTFHAGLKNISNIRRNMFAFTYRV